MDNFLLNQHYHWDGKLRSGVTMVRVGWRTEFFLHLLFFPHLLFLHLLFSPHLRFLHLLFAATIRCRCLFGPSMVKGDVVVWSNDRSKAMQAVIMIRAVMY